MANSVDLEIRNCLSDESRVALLNLAHDGRISPQRRADLDKYLPVAAPANPALPPEVSEAVGRIQDAVRRYYNSRVAVPVAPSYCSPKANGGNFVPVAGLGRALGSHPDTLLVHVVDLMKHLDAFQQAGLPGVPGSRPLAIGWLKKNVPMFPERTVPGRSAAEVDDFVDQALDVIFRYEAATRPPPTWVALFRQFMPHASRGPNAWLQVMGMRDSYNGQSRYPLVLVYKLRDVGTLIRPTQLEAGFDAFHFPSPPPAPVSEGGFAMDRSPSSGQQPPLSEFLHEPRPCSAEDWRLGGRLAGPTVLADAGGIELSEARRRHYGRLKLKYQATSTDWLRDTTSLT